MQQRFDPGDGAIVLDPRLQQPADLAVERGDSVFGVGALLGQCCYGFFQRRFFVCEFLVAAMS
jgi:hypothetical protein